MDYENKLKIVGKVEEILEVWKGDKGSLYQVRLLAGELKGKDFFAIVKIGEDLHAREGFGIGAQVEFLGRLTARQGRDGRWWGEASCHHLKIISAAPKASASASKSNDDDMIPW